MTNVLIVGVAIGVVLGLAWGDATWESSGATFPMAIPLGILFGLIGLGLTAIRGRRGATVLGGLAGGLIGATRGAGSPDAAAIPILAAILGLTGALAGRHLGRDARRSEDGMRPLAPADA